MRARITRRYFTAPLLCLSSLLVAIASIALMMTPVDPSGLQGNPMDDRMNEQLEMDGGGIEAATSISVNKDIDDLNSDTHAHPRLVGLNLRIAGVHIDMDAGNEALNQWGYQFDVQERDIYLDNQLRLDIDVGDWRKGTVVGESTKDLGGSWAVIAKASRANFNPSNTRDFDTNANVIWDQSRDVRSDTTPDHSYLIPTYLFNPLFDDRYGTNAIDDNIATVSNGLYGAYYLHVYMWFEGGGTLYSISAKARRVAVFRLFFKDEASIPSGQRFDLAWDGSGYFASDYVYRTGTISLGNRYHSVNLEGINAGNYRITVKDGTTTIAGFNNVYIQDVSGNVRNPFYFDRYGTPVPAPRIHKPSEGHNGVILETDLTISRVVSHNSNGHVYSFTFEEPSGINGIIPEGAIFDLGYMEDDGFDFLSPIGNGGEGFIRDSSFSGWTYHLSDIVPDIHDTYSVSLNNPFNSVVLTYRLSDPNDINSPIKPRVRFTVARSAPVTFTITFTRIRSGLAGVSRATLGISTERIGDTIGITWKNLRSLIPVLSDESFYDSANEPNADFLNDFANVNDLEYRIETLDGDDSVKFILDDTHLVSNLTAGTYGAWSRIEDSTIRSNFDISDAPGSKTLFQFKLSLAYGDTNEVAYNNPRRKWVNIGGALVLTGTNSVFEFPIFYDVTASNPAGAFGTVSFTSDDIVTSGGIVKDPDGEFFLQAGISTFSNTDGFRVGAFPAEAPLDPRNQDAPNFFDVNTTGSLLTVSSTQVFGLIPATGRYQFTITPYRWEFGNSDPVLNYNVMYGDEVGESAQGSLDSYLAINVIVPVNPVLKFSPNGEATLVGSTLLSETGIVDVVFSNLGSTIRSFLVQDDEVVLEQFVGGIKQHEIRPFDDSVYDAFRLFDDPDLVNTRIYSPGEVASRFLDLQGGDTDGEGNPISIGEESNDGNIRGMIDGTYVYKGKYNYENFGIVPSLTNLQFTIQSGRTLTANNEPSSLSIFTDTFTLDWNPTSEITNDLIEDGKVFYIVLFGKASDGVNVGSFTGDLGSLPSTIKILEQNGTSEEGSEVWNDRVFGKSETTVVIDNNFGDDGQPAFDIPDGTTETFYFAVMPFYKARVDQQTSLQFDWWYHGDVSNVVEVAIDRQVFTTLNIDPSRREGNDRVTYSQGTITLEVLGLTGGIAVADAANATITTWEDQLRNVVDATYFADMTATGDGRFELTVNVFNDLLVDDVIKYASACVKLDYTSAGLGDGIVLEDNRIVINTGVTSSINFISPGEYGVIAPSSEPGGELLFGINIFTDPAFESAFNLPRFDIDPEDVSVVSVDIVGHGDLASFGTIQSVVGTFNWRITLDDLFELPLGVVRIDLVARATTGTVTLDVPASLSFIVRHDPTIAVFSPGINVGDVKTVPGYAPINVKWVAFYGSNLPPDEVELIVTKNDQPFFFGDVVPSTFFYQYTIDPLQHDSGDIFSFAIIMARGSEGVGVTAFSIELDFEVTIVVDLGEFEYDSSNPQINGKVDAFVPVEYPVGYDLFFLETNQVIFNPQDYRLVRDLGNETLIEFIPRDLGTSTQLVFEMEGRPATQGNIDHLVFEIPGPTVSKKGFNFPEENKGTLYVENITITSQYRFTDLNVTIVPSATFSPRSDEVWNVTVDGVQVPVTLTESRHLNFIVDAINPGQVITITIIHYNEDEVILPEPEPPPTEQPTILQQIISFFTAIITFILSLFGLAWLRKKRSFSLGEVNV